MRVVLLAGGTGGAKLGAGLADRLDPNDLTIVVNTADDDEFWGLMVSPDVDAILYRLAGLFNEQSGFGVADDSFNALSMLRRLGEPTWFALGDEDIGLHLLRTHLAHSRGLRPTETTREITRRLGLATLLVPMSDDAVRTRVLTDAGEIGLQEWFVARSAEPPVRGLRFEGMESARAAPEAVEAVTASDVVIIGPSNPLISIDPILMLLGATLKRERVIAVSPIVDGRSLKGPTAQMLRDLGEEPTALGVARHYAGTAAWFIVDSVDAALQPDIAALGMQTAVCDTVMADANGQRRLAGDVMRLAERARSAHATA